MAAPSPDPELLTIARLARVVERGCANLTLAQYRVLALVAEGEDRASRVARQLALAKPTVSATVDALVGHGLLARDAAEGDRRALRLTATDAGRAALREAESGMRSRLDEVLAHVGDPALVARVLAELGSAIDARRTERASRRDRDDGAHASARP